MHGGSGLPHEDYIKAMECGVEKINYYSYMGKAGVNSALEAINSNKYTFYHEIAHESYLGMKEDSLKAMKVFYKKYISHTIISMLNLFLFLKTILPRL